LIAAVAASAIGAVPAVAGPEIQPIGIGCCGHLGNLKSKLRTSRLCGVGTAKKAPPKRGQMREEERVELNERDVIAALNAFDALWGSLFPAEQARIVHLLVQRVSVSSEGIAVDLRTEGLGSVIREMITPRTEEAIA
jgi:hypothetical protein